MWTILLLVLSNVFMTLAWYGHLKFPRWPLWIVILASWGLAFAEYCFQVPANRIGHTRYGFTVVELKTIQEVLTLAIVVLYAMFAMGEKVRWNHVVGFVMLIGAVVIIFKKW